MKHSLLVLLIPFAGCLDGQADTDTELASAQQDVYFPSAVVSTCPDGACTSTISNGAGVCFISEIDGDLAHGGSATVRKGFGGVWYLDLVSPHANNLKVRTECVTLRGLGATDTKVSWSSQSMTNPVFHGTATSRCFLSQVTTNNTSAFLAFDTSFQIAGNTPGAYDYRFLGVFPGGADVTLAMECFNAPTFRGEVAYGAEFFRWFSEESVRISGRFSTAPNGATRLMTMKGPVGPTLMVT
ncbi:MAG: hypothetical protein ABI678_23255, partial [Kofleriaceae bacterium]